MVDFDQKLREYQAIKDTEAAVDPNAASTVEESCLAGCGHSVYIHGENGCNVDGCECKCQVSEPVPVRQDDTPLPEAVSGEVPDASPQSTPVPPASAPASSGPKPRTPRKAAKSKTVAPPPVAPSPLPKPEVKLHKALTKRHVKPTYKEEVAAQRKHERERTGNYANGNPIKVSIPKVVAPPKPKPQRATVSKAPVLCGCGCGDTTKGGRFRPGHDAKYYAALKKAGKPSPHHK